MEAFIGNKVLESKISCFYFSDNSSHAGPETTIFYKNMIGDRTGSMHIGPLQSMDLERPYIDLPFSAHVYKLGHLGLAPVTHVHGVTIWLSGALTHVRNITVRRHGRLWLNRDGRVFFTCCLVRNPAMLHVVLNSSKKLSLTQGVSVNNWNTEIAWIVSVISDIIGNSEKYESSSGLSRVFTHFVYSKAERVSLNKSLTVWN